MKAKTRNRIKRSMSVFMLFFFFINVVPVHADRISEETKIKTGLAIMDRLDRLSIYSTGYTDDRGLIYSLSNLINVGMWYEFACNNTDAKVTTLAPYENYLQTSVSRFNTSYKNKVEGLSVSLSIAPESVKFTDKKKEQSAKFVNTMVHEYKTISTILLNNLLAEYNKLSDDKEKEKFLDTNSLTIQAIYLSVDRAEQEKKDIVSLCNITDANLSGTYVYRRSLKELHDLVNDTKFKVFKDKAESMADEDILAMDSGDTLEGTDARDSYLTELDGVDRVNFHYLKAFACSSVYQPYVSILGEEGFSYALKELDDDPLALDTYNKIAKYKKPLYIRELASTGLPKKEARKVNVKEFNDLIKNGKSGVLVAPKGKFQKSKDSDAFAVYNGDGDKVYDDNGEPADPNAGNTNTNNNNNNNNNNNTDNNNNNNNTDNDNNNNSTDNNNNNTTTTPNNDNTGVGQNMESEGQEYVLGNTITDEKLMSEPVFEFGEASPWAMTNLVMMHNNLIDSKAADKIETPEARHLYLNPFGDIVMDDDTVVVPAASNASYYNKKEVLPVYNGATAGFLNSYPRASLDAKYFSASDRDGGKMIIGMSPPLDYLTKVEDVIKKDKNSATLINAFGYEDIGPQQKTYAGGIGYIVSEDKSNLKTWQYANTALPLDFTIFEKGGKKPRIMVPVDFKFGSDEKFQFSFSGVAKWFNDLTSNVRLGSHFVWLTVPDTSLTIHGKQNLFPLVGEGQEYLETCKYVADKYFLSMVYDENGTIKRINKRYDIDYITGIFEEGYKGTNNANQFIKNSKQEYLAENKGGVISTTVRDIAQKTSDSLGDIRGVIGLRNAYQDPILGKFLFYVQKFIPMLILMTAVFFIVKYASNHVNFTYMVCMTGLGTFLTYLFLMVIPIYLPIICNGIINNFSDDLAYKALFMKLERYEDAYDMDLTDPTSFNKTTSVNLYELTKEQIDTFCSQRQLSTEQVMSGKPYIINEESGLFIQGNLLKINMDRLMAGTTIKGNYGDEVDARYELQVNKYISNPMDYYTPYYLMLDSFTEKLNKFESLYNIPPSGLNYANGIHKDSFLFNSYIKSDLVLNSENLEVLKEQFDENHYRVATNKAMFGTDNIDFMGLRKVFVDDISKNYNVLKDTLWFNTMVSLGYYDAEGNITDAEGLSKMIVHVNKIAKKFIIETRGHTPFVSDENLIKSATLYAMCELHRYINMPKKNVYPQSLNYEEITLNDALLPVITKDFKRYSAVNQDIIKYVEDDFGVVGLALFIVLTIQSWLIVSIMNICLPVLYIILLICLIIRLATNRDSQIAAVFKGYLKVFLAICFCYFGFTALTAFTSKFNDSIFTIFVLIIIYSIFLAIIGTVLSALIMSGFDFGSSRVNSSIRDLADKFKIGGVLDGIKNGIKGMRMSPAPSVAVPQKMVDKHSYKKSMDDIYGLGGFDNLNMSSSERKRFNDIGYSGKVRVNSNKKNKGYTFEDYDDDEDDFENDTSYRSRDIKSYRR